MPPWVSDLLTPQTLGVLAALIFIAWLAYKIAPALRKLSHLVDDLAGEPARPGVPARPGLMERMASVEDASTENTRRLDIVQKEVKNSHITNLREDMDQIRDEVRVTSSKLDTHIQIAADESRMLRDIHTKYVSREDHAT